MVYLASKILSWIFLGQKHPFNKNEYFWYDEKNYRIQKYNPIITVTLVIYLFIYIQALKM